MDTNKVTPLDSIGNTRGRGTKLPTPGSKLPTPGSRLQTPSSLPTLRQRVRIPSAPGLMETQTSTEQTKRKANGESAPPMKKQKPNPSRPQTKRAPATTTRTDVDRPPIGRAAAKPPANPTGMKRSTSSQNLKTTGKKRPQWDLKGRLQDMEQEMGQRDTTNNTLQTQIAQTNERLAMLENVKNNMQNTVAIRDMEITSTTQELEDLDHKYREARIELQDLEFNKGVLERQKRTLEAELAAEQQQVAGLKCSMAALTAAQSGMEAELKCVKMLLEKAQKDNKELKSVVELQENTIVEMEGKLRNHETERRKLHNTIQELKGNIRVFCRVRPLLGDECLGNEGTISHLHFPDTRSEKKLLEMEKLADISPNESVVSSHRGSNSMYEFSFDKVFNPEDGQAPVFEEISQLVQSALDGYHVCIFAYGQTGSGKTYTMEGPDHTSTDDKGMIPRAVQQVFSTAASLQDKGWEYKFEVSFLEIYNETIRDLLGSGGDNVKCDIKMVQANSSEVVVTNLETVTVAQPGEVHKLLRKAGENRAVAETKCNQRSSRSHSVFQMKISGKNTITEEHSTGLMNLIDLAGSERLKDSGSQGQRLKETQSINKSLANLGNVIMALGNKDPHIPYRNSKLTHLLQHCLGGNSKVLMFVNVSPKEECFGETLNSLRFATKVNNCNIGTAKKSTK